MSSKTFSNDYRTTYDIELLNMLKTTLSSEKHKNKPTFILMPSMGSHYDYSNRVPKEFQIFHTTDEKLKNTKIDSKGIYCDVFKNKSLGDIIDSYDATILYTDYVLDSIIEELKNKNALFVYVSDHGESFGERGQACLHGYDVPEVWHIPMIFWASDKFIQNNPQKWKDIQLSVQQELDGTRMISHDNIIHTLLEGASIESEFINKKLSLFNQDTPIYLNKFEGCKRFKKQPLCYLSPID